MTRRAVRRRKLLAGVSSAAAVLLAGCGLGEWEPEGSQIAVRNRAEQSVTVSLTVEHVASGKTIIDESLTLEPSEDHDYERPFEESGEKRLTAALDSGASEQYTWVADAEGGPNQVNVRVEDQNELSVSLIIA
jgi:hypothetical protein